MGLKELKASKITGKRLTVGFLIKYKKGSSHSPIAQWPIATSLFSGDDAALVGGRTENVTLKLIEEVWL